MEKGHYLPRSYKHLIMVKIILYPAEKEPFTRLQLNDLLDLSQKGLEKLHAAQASALKDS